MSSVDPSSKLISPRESPATVDAEIPLPLRATDFDAGIAELLHDALAGARRTDILNGLCQHLVRTVRVRLAVLLRRCANGSLASEGASAENALWLDLQRIPERWDDGLSSHGPAGAALRSNSPVHMRLADEGFALWRAGAEAEHVREMLALPMTAADGTHVLELYFDGEVARGASVGTLKVGQLSRRLETFLADLATIEQQRLVSQALSCAGNAAFITDIEGMIVWSNSAFSMLSGYTADEVRGRNPSLLRSGEQGVRYYRDLWNTVRAGEVWSGETVDLRKGGQKYTIHQTISPVSQDGRVTHYVSIHQDIGQQKKTRIELERATHKDSQTGLMTATAFEDAARDALADAHERPVAFVMVSLRGLQQAAAAMEEDMERLVIVAMGKRVRETIAASDLAASLGNFEYALLLRGDVSEPVVRSRLRALGERLNEPLPYIGALADLDIHFGIATAPASTATLQELRLRADRQLADQPHRRARRDVTH